MKIDANLYFCSEVRREDHPQHEIKLPTRMARERKLLEIFCEIVTMMERSSGEMPLYLSTINISR